MPKINIYMQIFPFYCIGLGSMIKILDGSHLRYSFLYHATHLRFDHNTFNDFHWKKNRKIFHLIHVDSGSGIGIKLDHFGEDE